MRTYDVYAQPTVIPVAGKTAIVDLETSQDTRYLMLTLKARTTIGAANAAAIRNFGTVAAMYDRIRLTESGRDTGLGKLLGFWIASEAIRGSAGSFTRQSAVANGTVTNLVEVLMIPFERLVDALPAETRYRVSNAGLRFQLQFDLNATPGLTVLDNTGGATVTVDNLSIDVRQYVAPSNDAKLPQFAPRWREQILGIPGAAAQARLELDVGNDYIAGVTLMQETTTVGLVSDIITSFQLRNDDRIFIGENGMVPLADYARDQEWKTSGNVFTLLGGSGVHFDFREAGRKSHIISPSQGNKLRFLFNAAPSASAGASQIRALIHALSRDVAVGAGGRKIIAPSVTFPV